MGVKRLTAFFFMFFLGDSLAAKTKIDSLLVAFKNSQSKQEKIITLSEISAHYSQSDFLLSRNFAFKAYNYSKEIGYNKGWAKSAMSLGYAYDYHAQYDSAVYYYLESLKVYEILNDTIGQSSALNNLGVCYFFSNQLNYALIYYKKSLSLEIATNNQQGIADSYNNIAVIFKHNNNLDSAETYLYKSWQLYKTLNNIYGIAGIHMNLGQLELKRNNIKAAIKQTQIAKNYFYKSDKWSDAGSALNSIATMFLEIHRLDSARFYASTAYNLNKSKGFNQFLLNSLDILISVDTLEGNFKNAVEHLLERSEVQQFLHQNFKDEQIENARNYYELGSKEKEIFSLQTNNSAKDIKITEKKEQVTTLTLLIIAFGLLLLIIAIALLKLRKVNLKLVESNLQVKQNLEEKDWLLKEIHHRVKNNLQIVSSLLSLQTRYISDKSAINAINNSQDRVQTISILHQEIYRNDVLKKIPASDYFSRLIDGIQLTFDAEKKVQLERTLDTLLMDVDELLPLGLMLNEMLTNAYKYGCTSISPRVIVTFSVNGSNFELKIKDNGKNHPTITNLESINTLGMKLIEIFAKKMKAEVSINNNSGFEIAVLGKLKTKLS